MTKKQLLKEAFLVDEMLINITLELDGDDLRRKESEIIDNFLSKNEVKSDTATKIKRNFFLHNDSFVESIYPFAKKIAEKSENEDDLDSFEKDLELIDNEIEEDDDLLW